MIHDTIRQVIYVHDSIQKGINSIDTLKVLNIGMPSSNNSMLNYWLTVALSSLIIGLILFILNLLKDSVFARKQNRDLLQRIKFEKTYSRVIEVIEEIIKQMDILNDNVTDLKNRQITDCKVFSDNLRNFNNFLRIGFLYIPDEIILKINDYQKMLGELNNEIFVGIDSSNNNFKTDKDTWILFYNKFKNDIPQKKFDIIELLINVLDNKFLKISKLENKMSKGKGLLRLSIVLSITTGILFTLPILFDVNFFSKLHSKFLQEWYGLFLLGFVPIWLLYFFIKFVIVDFIAKGFKS